MYHSLAALPLVPHFISFYYFRFLLYVLFLFIFYLADLFHFPSFLLSFTSLISCPSVSVFLLFFKTSVCLSLPKLIPACYSSFVSFVFLSLSSFSCLLFPLFHYLNCVFLFFLSLLLFLLTYISLFVFVSPLLSLFYLSIFFKSDSFFDFFFFRGFIFCILPLLSLFCSLMSFVSSFYNFYFILHLSSPFFAVILVCVCVISLF